MLSQTCNRKLPCTAINDLNGLCANHRESGFYVVLGWPILVWFVVVSCAQGA